MRSETRIRSRNYAVIPVRINSALAPWGTGII
jgi:hypothetical protein